jgi:hypothetical protein
MTPFFYHTQTEGGASSNLILYHLWQAKSRLLGDAGGGGWHKCFVTLVLPQLMGFYGTYDRRAAAIKEHN